MLHQKTILFKWHVNSNSLHACTPMCINQFSAHSLCTSSCAPSLKAGLWCKVAWISVSGSYVFMLFLSCTWSLASSCWLAANSLLMAGSAIVALLHHGAPSFSGAPLSGSRDLMVLGLARACPFCIGQWRCALQSCVKQLIRRLRKERSPKSSFQPGSLIPIGCHLTTTHFRL